MTPYERDRLVALGLVVVLAIGIVWSVVATLYTLNERDAFGCDDCEESSW